MKVKNKDILKDFSDEIFEAPKKEKNNSEIVKEEIKINTDINDNVKDLFIFNDEHQDEKNNINLTEEDSNHLSLNDINKIIEESIMNNELKDEDISVEDAKLLLEDIDEEDISFNDLNERSEQIEMNEEVIDNNDIYKEESKEIITTSNFPKLEKFGSVTPQK